MNTAPFEINNGHISIPFSVRGFWSSDVIHLYVRRDFYGENKWTVDISVSSGGRDTKEIEQDTEAYAMFARTLEQVVSMGETYLARMNDLEAGYQKYIETVIKPQQEAERLAREARQAQLDADPEISAEDIRYLLGKCIKNTRAVLKLRSRDTLPERVATIQWDGEQEEWITIITGHNRAQLFSRNLSFVKKLTGFSQKYSIMS